MSVVSDVAERLRALLRRNREDRELAAELAFHLDMETEKGVRDGLTPADARRRAHLALGNVARVTEEVRDARGTRLLEELRQDVVFGLRTFRRHAVFALSVLLILALGIGANTATFTVIHALVLRTLPVPDADRLVTIGDPANTGRVSRGTPASDIFSYPLYLDLRDQNRTLSGLYATGRTGRLDVTVSVSGGEVLEHPRGRLVTGNFFTVLDVPAQIGRTFTAAEDVTPLADPVVVLSDSYWRRRFGADPTVIGRTMTINGSPFTIVGVGPPGFAGDIVGQPTDVWIPMMMQPAVMPNREWLDSRGASWLLLMGRLAPGVPLPRARAELAALTTRLLLEHAPADEAAAVRETLDGIPVSVAAGARGFSYYRDVYASALATLMAAVGLVLLIVCANVGNLMLARAEARRREMGMRLALGAGRWRLVRQLLTESTLLALAGGVLGLLLARWGSRLLLVAASAGPDPLPLDVPLEPGVLAFNVAVALGAALLFGLLPALRTTRVELTGALRSGGRGAAQTGATRRRHPAIGRALVAAQFALSLLLLVGTAMLVRSVRSLEGAGLGMDRDRLVIVAMDPVPRGYMGDRYTTLIRDITARIAAVPGVAGVSASENGLFSGSASAGTLGVEGFTPRTASDTNIAYDYVGPDYFHTLGAHLVLGRDFSDADRAGAPGVAILNQSAARFFFRDASPIGRHIRYGGDSYAIVGVVDDIEGEDIRSEPARRLYLPAAQAGMEPGRFYVQVRADGDPASLVEPVRQAVLEVDPLLDIIWVRPLTDLVARSIRQDRMVSTVATLFGVLALLLAALGLYGVMAYTTSRRTGEFGVRLALGARPADVMRMMLREALVVTAAGLALGLPGTFLVARMIRAQLFGVGTFDPPSFAAAVAVLGMSATLAGCIPALRAAATSPVEALRGE